MDERGKKLTDMTAPAAPLLNDLGQSALFLASQQLAQAAVEVEGILDRGAACSTTPTSEYLADIKTQASRIDTVLSVLHAITAEIVRSQAPR